MISFDTLDKNIFSIEKYNYISETWSSVKTNHNCNEDFYVRI